jgi:hypothetical protein
MGDRVVIYSFNDADALGREIALFAKAQDIDPGAGPDGREEILERTGGGCSGWLVSGHGEGTKMGVHARITREVDDHFHEKCLQNKKLFPNTVYWMLAR